MLINYDVRKLDKALSDFYNVTGVSISILSEDFSPLGSKKANNAYCRLIQSNKEGRIRCLEFNRELLERCKETREPLIKICRAGLVEIAVPLIYEDKVIGYAILGHIRPDGEEIQIRDGLVGLPIDLGVAKELFASLPIYNDGRLESIMNMASMFGRYLVFDGLIKPKTNKYFDRIKKYIEDNIDKKLTPKDLSSGTYLSKSTLYSTVNSQLGCSVSEFICRVKIERAKELLCGRDLTVKDVSDHLGFSSPSYFAKEFKGIVGVSPMQFKKDNSERDEK